MAITFSCPTCSKKFKVKVELAGKPVKCPCGAGFKVPQSRVPPAKPLSDPATADTVDFGISSGDTGFADLLDEAILPESFGRKRCPSCKEPIDTAAVLCIECGYHLEKGKRLTTKRTSN